MSELRLALLATTTEASRLNQLWAGAVNCTTHSTWLQQHVRWNTECPGSWIGSAQRQDKLRSFSVSWQDSEEPPESIMPWPHPRPSPRYTNTPCVFGHLQFHQLAHPANRGVCRAKRERQLGDCQCRASVVVMRILLWLRSNVGDSSSALPVGGFALLLKPKRIWAGGWYESAR